VKGLADGTRRLANDSQGMGGVALPGPTENWEKGKSLYGQLPRR